MKTLRKILPLLVLTAQVTACSWHTSDAGEKKDIIGTYQLTSWTKKHNPDDEETYSHMDEIQAKAYFTIDEKGYGYYGYKDKDTEARVTQVFSTFEKDEEKSTKKKEKFSSVTLLDGVTKKWAWEKSVGCGDEPSMGFHVKKHTLSYNIPYHVYTIYNPDKVQEYQYVCYTRISTETTLAKINSLLGTSVSFNKPYELKAMNGYYLYSCYPKDSQTSSKGVYQYAILDMESYANGKLTVHYSLAADPGYHTAEVPVTIIETGRGVEIQFNGKGFHSSNLTERGLGRSLETSMSDYSETDLLNQEYFNAAPSGMSLEELIAEATILPEV